MITFIFGTVFSMLVLIVAIALAIGAGVITLALVVRIAEYLLDIPPRFTTLKEELRDMYLVLYKCLIKVEHPSVSLLSKDYVDRDDRVDAISSFTNLEDVLGKAMKDKKVKNSGGYKFDTWGCESGVAKDITGPS